VNILFVHRYFPTQFRHLATALAADTQNRVIAISHPKGGDSLHVRMPADSGVRIVSYGEHLPQDKTMAPRHVLPLVNDMGVAWAVFSRARALMFEDGFVPDLICANSLWGEGLYLRELFPNAKILTHLELFYHTDRGHGFDPPQSVGKNPRFPMLSKNASLALAAATMDWGLASTKWQRDQFPEVYHSRISVIHEGVDTDRIAPGPATFTIKDKGLTLKSGDEVVTYAARVFEKVRGSDQFLRAIPAILEQRPNAQIVVVGPDVKRDKDGRLPGGITDVSALLSGFGKNYDPKRVHFVGRLEHAEFVSLLKISHVHVYLTEPFILSWSFLEAMACGCAIVSSYNPPVTEIIENKVSGLLVDFFDESAIAQATVALLSDETSRNKYGAVARRTIVDQFDLQSVCIPQQLSLINRLLANEPG
jgi:glycosyltransferase involved in cell wall biosynthesis